MEPSLEIIGYPHGQALPEMDRHVTSMVASMKVVGQLQPILVDKDGTVIDGKIRMRATRILGIDAQKQILDPVPTLIRAHTFVRRLPGPMELADIVSAVRAEENPSGARRAPGTGKAQVAVARHMADAFGLNISPRQVSLALALAALPADERLAVEAASPETVAAAHKVLTNHRLGISGDDSAAVPVDRTELIKTGYEFKAAAIRCGGQLTDADRALLRDLRDLITGLLGDI